MNPPRQLPTYQHYKGGLYLKLHEAFHTETEETLVIYACAASGMVFARPKASFDENVMVEGYTGPRFRPVPDSAVATFAQRHALLPVGRRVVLQELAPHVHAA